MSMNVWPRQFCGLKGSLQIRDYRTQIRTFSVTSFVHNSASTPKSQRPPFKNPFSYNVTEPPNPGWKLADGLAPTTSPSAAQWQQDEAQGWKTWATASLPNKDMYRLLTTAVIPRPIAFVSTVSEDGIPNLAPMSYFSLLSSNPPLLMVSFSLGSRKPKDSRENIKATGQFTVSIISEPFIEAANLCAVEAPAEIDEWVLSGLTPEPSIHVRPPYVRESAVSFECELNSSYDIAVVENEPATVTIAIGSIKHIHARRSVLTADGEAIDPEKLSPIARLGGNFYSRLGERFELPRPSWKALKEEAGELMKKAKSQ